MKYYHTMVMYGKNKRLVEVANVTEDAMEQFKEEYTNKIRSLGWMKEISFKAYVRGESEDPEKATCHTLVYTKDGFDWWYPVK